MARAVRLRGQLRLAQAFVAEARRLIDTSPSFAARMTEDEKARYLRDSEQLLARVQLHVDQAHRTVTP